MFFTLSNMSHFSCYVAYKWSCFADSLDSCETVPIGQPRRKKLKAVNGFFPSVFIAFCLRSKTLLMLKVYALLAAHSWLSF